MIDQPVIHDIFLKCKSALSRSIACNSTFISRRVGEYS